MKYVKTHESFSSGSYRWLIMYDKKYAYSANTGGLSELEHGNDVTIFGFPTEEEANHELKELDEQFKSGVIWIEDPYDPAHESGWTDYSLSGEDFEIVKFFVGVQMVDNEETPEI